jgi:hypothetical protein
MARNRTLHASNVSCPISSSVYNPSFLRVTRETGTCTVLRFCPLVFRAHVSEQSWETVLIGSGSLIDRELALSLLVSSSSLELVSNGSSLGLRLRLADGATEGREGVIEELNGIMGALEGIIGALEGIIDGLDGPLSPRGLLFLLGCVSGEALRARSGSDLLGLSSTRSSRSLMVLSRSAILASAIRKSSSRRMRLSFSALYWFSMALAFTAARFASASSYLAA